MAINPVHKIALALLIMLSATQVTAQATELIHENIASVNSIDPEAKYAFEQNGITHQVQLKLSQNQYIEFDDNNTQVGSGNLEQLSDEVFSLTPSIFNTGAAIKEVIYFRDASNSSSIKVELFNNTDEQQGILIDLTTM